MRIAQGVCVQEVRNRYYMVDAVTMLLLAGGIFSAVPGLTEPALLTAMPERGEVAAAIMTVFPEAGSMRAALTFTQAFPPGENPLTCQLTASGVLFSSIGFVPLATVGVVSRMEFAGEAFCPEQLRMITSGTRTETEMAPAAVSAPWSCRLKQQSVQQQSRHVLRPRLVM
jgi:hypothetical protein